jgi:hypothetical protein
LKRNVGLEHRPRKPKCSIVAPVGTSIGATNDVSKTYDRATTALASRLQKDQVSGPPLFSTSRKAVTSPSAASEGSAAASGRDSKGWLASCSAFAVALLLLAATLSTLFEKNLVDSLSQQGWTRELYAISAALTKMRFGIGGSAVDRRIFTTLVAAGIAQNPAPELHVRFPDNLRNAKLLQSALQRAQTIDLPPAPADAHGDYGDLMGFSGEDTGLGTFHYLAFRLFGVNIPALTYLYFVIVTASLVLYGVGHWRSVGAMAAVGAVTLALYVVVCDDFVNFLGSSKLFSNGPGIDVKDPRFLGTMAAIPLLHMIVMWTRPRYRLGPLDYVVVVLQAAIFAFALQIRSPVVWAVLALSAFWVMLATLALRRGRSLRSLFDWRRSRSAPMPIAVLAVLFSAQLLAAVTLHPLYRAQGDVPRHMFWQGVLSSLEVNPEWFAKYGPSVNNATGDSLPEEAARIAIMQLPAEERQQYLAPNGWPKWTALEKFSRIVFFDILRNDPKFVAHAFFIDKRAQAWRSEQLFFDVLFSGLPFWNVLIPAVAVLFLVVLVAWNAEARATLLATAGVIPLFIVLSLLPNWLVALSPLVMIDNFVWIIVFWCCCS